MFKRKIYKDVSIENTIRQCPLFKGLSTSELKSSLSVAHIREYAIDEKIFSEGTMGLCFYIIAKGRVELVSEGVPGSKPKVLKEFNDGGFFSESHLFAETNHTVSGIAKELTKLIIFAKPDFEDLIKINPKTGNKLLQNFLEFMGIQLENLYKENIEMREKLNG
jgi:CRP-like cAMP-binding protein